MIRPPLLGKAGEAADQVQLAALRCPDHAAHVAAGAEHAGPRILAAGIGDEGADHGVVLGHDLQGLTPDGSVVAAVAHHVLGGADEIMEGEPAGLGAGVQVHAETLAGEPVEPRRAEPGDIIACAAGGAFGILLF